MSRPLAGSTLLAAALVLTSCVPQTTTTVSDGVRPTAATAADPTGSWPQWRGPNRDAKSPETGLSKDWDAKPPKLVWSAKGMGQGHSAVSVSNGRAYTTGNTKTAQAVVAVDVKDGTVLWTTPVTASVPKHGHGGARACPAIDGDHVYVVLSEGGIACLKASDGAVVWTKNFASEWGGSMMSGWGFSESPLVDGDRVLCTPGGKDALIVALDKRTGDEIWKASAAGLGGRRGGAGYSSLVVSNGGGTKQYVTIVGGGAVGVRASDGKLLWSYARIANGTANVPTPLVVDDRVFVSTGYGTGAALLELAKDGDGVKAEEKYFLPGNVLQNHHGGMVLVGNHVYLGHGHNAGFPTCVDLATGEIAWGGKLRGVGSGSAAVLYADGHLVFRWDSGEVGLVEATPVEYRLKGSFRPESVSKPCWSHPSLAGGRLYLRDQDTLMSYDVTDK